MEFEIVGFRQFSRSGFPEATDMCLLIQENWDDYGFKTLFKLVYFNSEGQIHKLGDVKIMNLSMTGGYTKFPEGIKLRRDHASLGQDQDYYENLFALDDTVRLEILGVLRDVVWSEQILSEVEKKKAFKKSLCRSVRQRDLRLFSSILRDQAKLTKFEFDYEFPGECNTVLRVQVMPHSIPPTNIHVVIGRNGVGKSRMLNSMSRLLVTGPDRRRGKLTFYSEGEESTAIDGFSSIVTVAFSAFDEFDTLNQKDGTRSGIKHSYIGLKKTAGSTGQKPSVQNKSSNDLKHEFVASVGNCLSSVKASRWVRAMRILESDPMFSAWKISELDQLPPNEVEHNAEMVFSDASSGHKIVLLSVTRLVELVGERTLVLVDEPESHLHPPLAASFVRTLSDLLTSRNGVALLATHSPVILQEVPKECVSLFFRFGDTVKIERPEFETFAGNLGRITRNVFGVEVGDSGFHNLIAEFAKESLSFDELDSRFGGQLGAEGRALARSILRSPESD